MASPGLKINLEKTKLMITRKPKKENTEIGKLPCGCCGKGVGTNSIICTKFKKWCHKRCTGIKTLKGAVNFTRQTCKLGSMRINLDESVMLKDDKIEEVHQFCFLGSILGREEGIEVDVRARVKLTWRRWKELASLLINPSEPLPHRAKVYEAWVRPAPLHGAETWAPTAWRKWSEPQTES